jgi:periplasmic protein TonB
MAVTLTLPLYHRSYELPWSAPREEKSRMQRALQISLGVVLLLCLIIPYLPLPERSVDAVEAVPPRLARLVLERRVVPPPPPTITNEVVPEAARPVAEVPVQRPRPAAPVTPDRVEEARRKAASSGLLAMQDQLASLRDNAATAKAVETRDLTVSAGEAARSDRSIITSGVGKGSGGINTASLSRGYGSGTGALAGHATTQVTSTIGGGDGAGDGPQVQRSSGSNKASRSREEIELVFDRNKSAIYALYSRALRDNPALQGKIVLQLTIAPSGEITACEVLSSDLNDPDLERKLVARIKLFRFEERDVEAITTTKPIDFFPA